MNLIEKYTTHREILRNAGQEGPWLLIFDIDSTLMDTAPRNRAILNEAVDRIDALSSWRRRLTEAPVGWNILEPLRKAGLEDRELMTRVEQFWRERFFTDEWLVHDAPYPGAAEFLHELRKRDFRLVYLTGRHSPGMEEGTRWSFERSGLPAGPREQFFFKPGIDEEDLVYKNSACDHIAKLGTVVGTLDNEPGNTNLYKRRFPHAANVWLNTICSTSAEPLDSDIPIVTEDVFLALPHAWEM